MEASRFPGAQIVSILRGTNTDRHEGNFDAESAVGVFEMVNAFVCTSGRKAPFRMVSRRNKDATECYTIKENLKNC